MNRTPFLTLARMTGLAYLALAICGGFAFFVVSEQMHFAGDAASTAAAILAEEGLFRMGVAAYWATLVLDVMLAWMIYRLLRDHDRDLALLSAWFRLAYVAIHGAAILELTKVLGLMDGGLAGQSELLQADMIQHHMEAHLNGFLLSLIVFGGHLITIGWIIISRQPLPRIIGVMVILAAVSYIIDGVAFILLQDYQSFYDATQTTIAVVATIGEVSLLLWLLIRGVKTPGQTA